MAGGGGAAAGEAMGQITEGLRVVVRTRGEGGHHGGFG